MPKEEYEFSSHEGVPWTPVAAGSGAAAEGMKIAETARSGAASTPQTRRARPPIPPDDRGSPLRDLG